MRPAWYWRPLLGLAWGVAILAPFLALATPLGLFGTPLMPLILLAMSGMLAPLHERTFAPPRCPRCRRILSERLCCGAPPPDGAGCDSR